VSRNALAALAIVSAPTLCAARTWSILPDGTGDAPTIQAAVDSAAALDTIELSAGVFQGAGNRDVAVGKELTFASQLGQAETCTIDCEGSAEEEHRGFLLSADCTFQGITVANGYTFGRGGGLYASEGVGATISDCAFTDNTAQGYGGALAFDSLDRAARRLPEVSVERSRFARNRAQSSGVVYGLGMDLVFTGCTFLSNEAADRGGVLSFVNCGVSFTSCLFALNQAGTGGGAVDCSDPAVFEQCTFVANSAPNGAHIDSQNVDGATLLSHSICAFGEISGDGRGIACIASEVTLLCSNLYGNEGGDFVDCLDGENGMNGNFSADPLFCDRDGGDFTLRSDSPCAPPGVTGCGLVGALPVGCDPVSVESLSWGKVKGAYR
jgi:hypothetical protein